MRATLIGGPCHRAAREVDGPAPDVLLCTDSQDPTLEHLYRLRGVEGPDGEGLAVYEYAAPEASDPDA